MTPNWPALWAREPGLAPTNRVGAIECVLRLSALSGEWYWLGTDREKSPPDEGSWGHESPLVAAALCRDAAVRWLLAQGFVIYPTGIVSQSFRRPFTAFVAFGTHVELGEMVFSACLAVLDARAQTRCGACGHPASQHDAQLGCTAENEMAGGRKCGCPAVHGPKTTDARDAK